MCAPPGFSVRAISANAFAGRNTCSKTSCVITSSKDSSLREIFPSILRGTRVSPAGARPHSRPMPRSTHTFRVPAATSVPLPECTAGIYLVELDPHSWIFRILTDNDRLSSVEQWSQQNHFEISIRLCQHAVNPFPQIPQLIVVRYDNADSWYRPG